MAEPGLFCRSTSSQRTPCAPRESVGFAVCAVGTAVLLCYPARQYEHGHQTYTTVTWHIPGSAQALFICGGSRCEWHTISSTTLC